jgi:hypothetical protein
VLLGSKLDCTKGSQGLANKSKKERAGSLLRIGGAEGAVAAKFRFMFEPKNLLWGVKQYIDQLSQKRTYLILGCLHSQVRRCRKKRENKAKSRRAHLGLLIDRVAKDFGPEGPYISMDRTCVASVVSGFPKTSGNRQVRWL